MGRKSWQWSIFCTNSNDEMGSALWFLVLTTKFPLSKISVEKQKKMICLKETLLICLLLLVDFFEINLKQNFILTLYSF